MVPLPHQPASPNSIMIESAVFHNSYQRTDRPTDRPTTRIRIDYIPQVVDIDFTNRPLTLYLTERCHLKTVPDRGSRSHRPHYHAHVRWHVHRCFWPRQRHAARIVALARSWWGDNKNVLRASVNTQPQPMSLTFNCRRDRAMAYKTKVQRSFQKTEWKTDGRTDNTDCYMHAFPAKHGQYIIKNCSGCRPATVVVISNREM